MKKTNVERNRLRRLRRLATRIGCKVHKLPGKYFNYCGPNYMITDGFECTRFLYSDCPTTYRVDLDLVEAWLKREDEAN